MILTKAPPASLSISDERRRIVEMVMNYRASKILLVAVWYDIFSVIDNEKNDLSNICTQIKTDPRATAILLDALVSLGFLTKNKEIYRNSPASENLLVRGKPDYMGNNLKYQELIWGAWSELQFVVQAGRPRRSLQDWLLRNESFGPEYIRGMQNIAERPAREIAALFPKNAAETLLDIGAGPGTYALAFLERFPNLQAYLLDLSTTVKIARNLISSHPLRDRVHFIPGNYHESNFGSERYDFVLMSHITHDEGEIENKRLIKKAYHALQPGGRLIIHDFVTNAEKTGPLFSALFSVHMLVYTEKGRVYSSEEYQSWLQEAGFERVKKHAICKNSPNASVALVGSRPLR